MLPDHTGQLVIPTESIRYWTRMIDRTEHTSFSAYTKTISRLESGPPKHGTPSSENNHNSLKIRSLKMDQNHAVKLPSAPQAEGWFCRDPVAARSE